ncbi:serine/threonine-protein kinase, partial [Actinomadura sp. KC345]|uniref:serine/threonine-protein kinase n=1 Tax=Actinomadura sp. KC345 TaxID=2530371 RepID=UPI00244105A6
MRSLRPARRGRDGRGVLRSFAGRASRRGEGDPPRLCRGPGVQEPLQARSGGQPAGRRGPHRAGGRRGRRRRSAVDGHRVRSRALAGARPRRAGDASPAHGAGTGRAGLAEALEAIHDAGMVHRDLKPSNILLAEDGPRVIDFGIARAADASGVTQRAGTPGFMAPEILTGGQPPSAAGDVFALGMVLAHASGTKPFGDGPAEALAFRIVNQEPELSGLDPELRGLVAGCLAKDPADRPSPRHLLDALAAPADEPHWLPPDVHTLVEEARPSTPPPA